MGKQLKMTLRRKHTASAVKNENGKKCIELFPDSVFGDIHGTEMRFFGIICFYLMSSLVYTSISQIFLVIAMNTKFKAPNFYFQMVNIFSDTEKHGNPMQQFDSCTSQTFLTKLLHFP